MKKTLLGILFLGFLILAGIVFALTRGSLNYYTLESMLLFCGLMTAIYALADHYDYSNN